MRQKLKKTLLLLPITFFLAVLFIFNPATSFAATVNGSWMGITTGVANIRTAPNTKASVIATYNANTNVTVYATVSGQVVWGSISSWYRISGSNDTPLYVYGGLVTHLDSSGSNTGNSSNNSNTGSTWIGVTTDTANVRNAPNPRASVVATYGPNTSVTVYATASGQVVWGNISSWYRISSPTSAPLYIYGGLVTHVYSGGDPGAGNVGGKVIVVNRADNVQELYAYDNGKLVFSTPVTTGSFYLQTFPGTFHVYQKLTNTTFYSPWGPDSPYYYAPEHVNYALDFDGAIYIHDAVWRGAFGPGTDRPHYDPKLGWTDGSHGCVNTSLAAIEWLYNWAPIGTTVNVIG